MNLFFVLGAADVEMGFIEEALTAQGLPFAHATLKGMRVSAATAYKANGIDKLVPAGAQVVRVECEVLGLEASFVVDHHREGDPGFGLGAQHFYEGSSLGQVLTLLGKTPTQRQRISCAADHCLADAYKGLCPGIAPQEVLEFRIGTRAAFQGVSEQELGQKFAQAVQAIQTAETVTVAGETLAWLPNSHLFPEASEASARLGVPLMYRMPHRGLPNKEGNLFKVGIVGARPETVQQWMDNCGLEGVYGVPSRGYAGGHFLAA